ncbi:MAG: CBS domain-containing protein [Streptosporangiaceae bacterium]
MKNVVRDIMTTRVLWVRPDASFKEIAAALHRSRVSAFPVLDENEKVIGVVSEADLLTKEALDGEPGVLDGILHHRDQQKARGITAGDLMSQPAVTAGPDDTIEDAARLMYARKVKRLPVVDSGDRLVGIISRADVLAVFDRSDADIHREITEDLILERMLVDPDKFMVAVKNGIVTLTGVPGTYEAGYEIVRLVRHVPGVVGVRDQLVYPPSEDQASSGAVTSFPID